MKLGYFISLDSYSSADAPHGRVAAAIAQVRVITHDSGEDRERILGQAPVEKDGSFMSKCPRTSWFASSSLDASGMLLVAERAGFGSDPKQRGCAGCHGDKALAPENRWPMTLKRFDTPTHLDKNETVFLLQKPTKLLSPSRRILSSATAVLLFACLTPGQSQKPAEHASPAANQASLVIPSYENVTERSHIQFQHSFGEQKLSSILEATGSGLRFLFHDNNDGLLDLYVLSGRYIDGVTDHSKADGKEATNHLYRNNGDGTFTDVTAQVGVPERAFAMGVTAETTTTMATRISTSPIGAPRIPHHNNRRVLRFVSGLLATSAPGCAAEFRTVSCTAEPA